VDIVLGVSMAPETVRLVLVEGESAGGLTVDEDNFDVDPESAAAAAADQVIAAILGTRESVDESGHQLQSSGVTWTDPIEADALRDALAAHKVENVMLVSAFMAAAALAQAVGSATNCARTALLFVEPTTATLAVVDSTDGSIADVHQQPLPEGDDAAVAELAAMVSGVAELEAGPESLFLVGSGVDIPLIKSALEASTSLSITVPEEPETALARGAALASANASLGASATVVIPQVRDPDPGVGQLAYSAVSDDDDHPYPAEPEYRSRKALVLAMSATAVFVVGVVALALALALGIRPHVEQRSSLSRNVVAPASQPPAPKVEAPAPPPPSAVPAPLTEAPSEAPAPVVQQPAPVSTPAEQLPTEQLPTEQLPPERPRWGHRRLGRGVWP
jgi:hypothetical protein